MAYPTTPAPSWYVFCAGAYRIHAEPSALMPLAIAPVAPHALPRAIVRTQRPWFSRGEWQSAALVLIVILLSAWYGFRLPPPR